MVAEGLVEEERQFLLYVQRIICIVTTIVQTVHTAKSSDLVTILQVDPFTGMSYENMGLGSRCTHTYNYAQAEGRLCVVG